MMRKRSRKSGQVSKGTPVRPQDRNATKQEQNGSMNYSGRGYCGVVCWANLSKDYVRQPATASVKSLASYWSTVQGIISL